MEKLGKEMVQHCEGLPLAIIALGGILTRRQGLLEWQKVYENVKSYLGRRDNIDKDQGLLNILELSYNDLPYQLKSCFLYLSKYQEDVEIETESLYQIWMAEGMISLDDKIGGETMMATAERYLRELAERSMVFVQVEEDEPLIKKFKSCRLHDIMRELCLRKAKEENFLQLINYPGRNNTGLVDPSLSTKTYRLAIYLDDVDEDDTSYVSLIRGASPELRSFTICSGQACHIEKILKIIMAHFKKLRVLIIENKDRSSVSLPSAIGECIHLRYLEMRSEYAKFILPSSIGNLKYLQTLVLRLGDNDLSETGIEDAKFIGRLKRLKHLDLPPDYFIGKVRLDGLRNLEILKAFVLVNEVEDMEKLINQVSKLKCLYLFSLGIVALGGYPLEMGLALRRQLFSLRLLTHLSLMNLKISKLPEYESCCLPNLHVLLLFQTEMEEDPMRTLEKLPNLIYLCLDAESYTGEEMICHATGFPQLKFLELEDLPNLKKWTIEEKALPNLSTLKIADCTELKVIPSGLRFIKTLKELILYHLPGELTRKLKAKDEQYNEICHVPSIVIV